LRKTEDVVGRRKVLSEDEMGVGSDFGSDKTKEKERKEIK
jgi:hypothetical protein